MFVSILRRKTRVTDRVRLESQLAAALPRIRSVLEASPGFVSVEYVLDVHEVGAIAQMTTWNTEDDCRRYVREGAAATAATLEEAALPTALHPDGAWVRHTYEIVNS
jgi:hypothetical protein